MENNNLENNNINIPEKGYYSKTYKTVLDLLIGILGTFLVIFIFGYLLAIFLPGTILICFVALIILLFLPTSNYKRIYIIKGIKIAVVIAIIMPLLFFGACLISLSGYGAR